MPLADIAEAYVFDPRSRAAAPDLINAEVLHALRRFERTGDLSEERSREALDDLMELPLVRYPTLALLERAWQLRRNFSGYDATYVALAEALDSALVTSDESLAQAARAYTAIAVVHLSQARLSR